ncbi:MULTISPECIES: HNH endonuclease [unclassified Caballeronia]|uniref:HNH endonuclease n=1 Tax=unclassified Caballeronia TaxID=2646786 RepID=UPI00025BC311|nr:MULTISPECIES: HNH endonuclease [unclassified Caballeronia]EKS70226.1 hypothetical protein BURK_019170 [Burkholderia sp. SJ98]MCE4546510.1 HNH endonuclease [Caballeronia sp. PC1]MCE4573017.1 HNH endonuclease [Caballeronia sp. CLC5]
MTSSNDANLKQHADCKIIRAHTPPYKSNGIALACALQTAVWLVRKKEKPIIVLWMGNDLPARDVLESAMSVDLVDHLLGEGHCAADGVQFNLIDTTKLVTYEHETIVALGTSVLELEASQVLDTAGALIFVPLGERDLKAYMRLAPDSNRISWKEEEQSRELGFARTSVLQQKLSWYRQFYKVVASDTFGGENSSRYVPHDGTGRCRYCGNSPPDATFRWKSHAFPEQIGNKMLVDLAECDACNRHFGDMLDDDFAKWTQPWRSVFRVAGRKGIPTSKSGDGKMRVQADDVTHLKLYVSSIGESGLIESGENRIHLRVERQAYVPMAAYKCIVKMALAVMPADYASECEHLKKWILEKSHTFESYKFKPLSVWLQFVPVQTLNGSITYAVLRRTDSATRVPYLMFVLQFSHLHLQIALPMHEQDKALCDGKLFEIMPFPHIGGLAEVEAKFGRSEVRTVDLSGVERVKGEIETIPFKYEQRVELLGNTDS